VFGKRPARCPVDESDRPWFDWAASWLVDALGPERVRGTVVTLPTQEFFPGQFDTSEASIRRLFPIVCARMGVDPALIRLEVIESRMHSELRTKLGLWELAGEMEHGDAGIYDEEGHPRVRFDRSGNTSVVPAIATLAHELGHYVLLGEKRLTGEEEDHELRTEMTTVFLGMGLFNANSHVWDHGGASGYLGYLDARQWGYTHALFAWFRKETDPAWAKHLRSDVEKPFREGLRYLAASGLALGELPPTPEGS
jgi:hypothetical protein